METKRLKAKKDGEPYFNKGDIVEFFYSDFVGLLMKNKNNENKLINVDSKILNNYFLTPKEWRQQKIKKLLEENEK